MIEYDTARYRHNFLVTCRLFIRKFFFCKETILASEVDPTRKGSSDLASSSVFIIPSLFCYNHRSSWHDAFRLSITSFAFSRTVKDFRRVRRTCAHRRRLDRTAELPVFSVEFFWASPYRRTTMFWSLNCRRLSTSQRLGLFVVRSSASSMGSRSSCRLSSARCSEDSARSAADNRSHRKWRPPSRPTCSAFRSFLRMTKKNTKMYNHKNKNTKREKKHKCNVIID